MALMARLYVGVGCGLKVVHLYKIKILKTPNVMSMSRQLCQTIPIRTTQTHVTKNLSLISIGKRNNKIASLELTNEPNRPLVILLSWLMAKKKHMNKYVNFYVEKGFDVLNVNMSPWQLLWPVKGAQVIAADIIKLLNDKRLFTPILIHGFSVGGYLWSEVLVQIYANRDANQHIADRIIGQIWDSAADLTEIPNGFSFAVFPNNKVLQAILRSYVTYHLKAFYQTATSHYLKGSEMFYTNLVKAPALFLVSKNDPIGTERSNLRVRDAWKQMGIQTYFKCWDKSPHVGHYHTYPEEYIMEVTNFLKSLNPGQMDQQASKLIKAKL